MHTLLVVFIILFSEFSCPALDSPRGGGIQICSFPTNDAEFNYCEASCPAADAEFVDDVPLYYTCGPSGSWQTLQDDQGLYPTCGRKC